MKLSFKDWWDSLTGVRGKIRDEDEGDAYFIALAAWNAALAQWAQPDDEDHGFGAWWSKSAIQSGGYDALRHAYLAGLRAQQPDVCKCGRYTLRGKPVPVGEVLHGPDECSGQQVQPTRHGQIVRGECNVLPGSQQAQPDPVIGCKHQNRFHASACPDCQDEAQPEMPTLQSAKTAVLRNLPDGVVLSYYEAEVIAEAVLALFAPKEPKPCPMHHGNFDPSAHLVCTCPVTGL